ncbi:Ribosome-releasing factor 2, mitochondrial [Chionoecetes opilio]|uniref:Ribosome-releasing factor 2, mitochondrial n=1 Tax=Chionoecetes opilio TaxID=41210 RepID=A0A8J4YL19_CHIOP|nr:Ribosome-releasing factor 2, mitochondrial [Chionoecetes opilio]
MSSNDNNGDVLHSDRGRQYLQRALTPEDEVWDAAQLARCELIDTLADLDTPLAEYVLERECMEDVPAPLMKEAIRRATLNQDAVAVVVGSSYKNVGVQPLMNAVVDYLPSPQDCTQPAALSLYAPSLCALAFKIVHDRQRGGVLTYLRVYSGRLDKGQRVYNLSGGRSERLGQVLIAYADHYKEVASVAAGNIVVVTGLQATSTGDTLVASHSVASAVQKRLAEAGDEDVTPTLLGVQVPDPVFFCSVEAPSASHQKALDEALAQLQREDPSLHVTQDEETGQTVLSGMGELHLEIIRDRIVKEYKVEAELGPLQVAYRETCTKVATHTLELDKMIGDRRQQVTITLSVFPSPDSKFKSVSYEYSQDNQENLRALRRYHLSAINRGVSAALRSGPVLSCPVVDLRVGLHWFMVRPGTSETMVAAAAAQCLQKVLGEGGCQLMEPVMVVEVVVEEAHTSTLLSDLSRRRANVLHLSHRQDMRVLTVECPLAELMGYSTAIRTLTSGTASFSMELSHYRLVNAFQQATIIEDVTGFRPS